MEAVVKIDEVATFETRGGNVRYVIKDSDGNEYTTFRESIGERAQQLEGQRVRIEYHEQQRGIAHELRDADLLARGLFLEQRPQVSA